MDNKNNNSFDNILLQLIRQDHELNSDNIFIRDNSLISKLCLSSKIVNIIKNIKNKLDTNANASNTQQIASSVLHIVNSHKDGKALCEILKNFGINCVFFPSIGSSNAVIANSEKIKNRAITIETIASFDSNKNIPLFIVTTPSGLVENLPLLWYRMIEIKTDDDINFNDLRTTLISRGFIEVDLVQEIGEFAVRGSIIDIFSCVYDNPVRLDFFDQKVEKITFFQSHSQRNINTYPKEIVLLSGKEKLNETINDNISNIDNNIFADSTFSFDDQNKTNANLLSIVTNQLKTHILICDYDLLPNVKQEQQSALALKNNELFGHNIEKNLDSMTKLNLVPDLISNDVVRNKLSDINNLNPAIYELRINYLDHYNPQLPPDDEIKLQDYFINHILLHIDYLKKHNVSYKNIVITAANKNDCDLIKTLFKLNSKYFYKEINDFTEIKGVSKSIFLILNIDIDKSFLYESILFLPISKLVNSSIRKYFKYSDNEIIDNNTQDAQNSRQVVERAAYEATSFEKGDLLVHKNYGIGQYHGLKTMTTADIMHDYLQINYQGSEKLFIPIENINLLTVYQRKISLDAEHSISLDSLSKKSWQLRKASVNKKIFEIAHHIVSTDAKRHTCNAKQFSITKSNMDKFTDLCGFIETNDQLKAITDITNDLKSGKVMNRLVCGDVGFGKTEVALRAAFIVANNLSQVVIVTPTTLLCQQHFITFAKRFAGFDIKISQLSRFTSVREKSKIRKDIQNGDINILITTHAAFSKNINWYDLGLIIIDEEQKFGVKHKEWLKNEHPSAHILMMSATPIPRTLQIALNGKSALSLIQTPPFNRKPIKTKIIEKGEEAIKAIIEAEISKGGQVLYVCPRISDVEKMEAMLAKIMPNTKVIAAHGGKTNNELEHCIEQFLQHKADILIATNIIESGLDITNANTIIIDRSDMFGMAQLHQIRGRTGRGNKQGYAYLTVPSLELLSTSAKHRLNVVAKYSSLGMGWQIASYDLENRGGGNLLGKEQSGFIKQIGFGLYQQMLSEAIQSITIMQNKQSAQETLTKDQSNQHLPYYDNTALDSAQAPEVELSQSVMIPADYISSADLRLAFYRRIAKSLTKEARDEIYDELTERFGAIPTEIKNLLLIMELKEFCINKGIKKLSICQTGVKISPLSNETKEKIAAWLQNYYRQQQDNKLANKNYKIHLIKNEILHVQYNNKMSQNLINAQFLKNFVEKIIQDIGL